MLIQRKELGHTDTVKSTFVIQVCRGTPASRQNVIFQDIVSETKRCEIVLVNVTHLSRIPQQFRNSGIIKKWDDSTFKIKSQHLAHCLNHCLNHSDLFSFSSLVCLFWFFHSFCFVVLQIETFKMLFSSPFQFFLL